MRAAFLAIYGFSAFASLALAQAPTATAKPSPESDPKVAAAMQAAKLDKRQQQYFAAVEDYKKAVKLSGGQCRRCLNDLYDLQMGMTSYKDAAATSLQLQAIADSPIERSIAEDKLGEALFKQAGDKPKPEQLQAVHATLQMALTDFPRNNPARWTDACVLARLGNKDDASKAFAACADAAAKDEPMRERALKLAAKPELSLNKMAPPFALTTADGQHFNLDGMQGRVVLIDFWATWCSHCVEGLPTVKKLAKEFANDPLTIISISLDENEAQWKEFIAKNEMTWLQYRDSTNTLSRKFAVSTIPHYFTVDSDGVLTLETGDTSDMAGRIKKLIKRAKDAKPATMGETTATSGAN